MKKLTLAVCLLLLCTSILRAAELSAEDLDRRRRAFRALVAEQWEYTLRTNPELASALGDRRYNDRLTDVSEAAAHADVAQSKKMLKRFEALDPTGFGEQERLDRELLMRNLRENIEAAKFNPWQMPVNQFNGIHLNMAQLPASMTFQTAKDYDDYIARLGKLPKLFDDTIANIRQGIAAKLVPPRVVLERVAEQAADIARAPAAESQFALPLKQFPAEMSDAEKERIRGAMLAAIERSVIPTYRRFTAFVRDEYLPRARETFGVGALPGGAARYAFFARQRTTSDFTPEQIHRIGLNEVARIDGEMLQIAKKLGYADVKSLNAAIEQNPDLKYKSQDQVLDEYRRFIEGMYARLPQFFGRLPKARVEVLALPAFRERGAAPAQYEPGASDGSRPGRVYVNTNQITSRKTITTEATAYHEGVPGHHMQLAIQQELPDLPMFRRQVGGSSAFIEGWGLYAEGLASEAGAYEDVYSEYGRLTTEMTRAIRLVADTGLHAKGWTRDQVVEFFHDHSALDEGRVQAEVDRYMGMPGQALAYKIGELKLRELRQRAEKELGPKFDIRSFHDEVLGAGAIPLQILEERITKWIARNGTR